MMGGLISIADVKTQDLTMLDVVNKRFSTIPASQYSEHVKIAMPAVPEGARAMIASMKTNMESRSTGRTAAIQGIQAEEQEFVLTIDMALPGAPPQAGPLMKLTFQIWTATQEEMQRVPALQEIRTYTAMSTASMNPTGMIKQILSGLPELETNLVLCSKKFPRNRPWRYARTWNSRYRSWPP